MYLVVAAAVVVVAIVAFSSVNSICFGVWYGRSRLILSDK